MIILAKEEAGFPKRKKKKKIARDPLKKSRIRDDGLYGKKKKIGSIYRGEEKNRFPKPAACILSRKRIGQKRGGHAPSSSSAYRQRKIIICNLDAPSVRPSLPNRGTSFQKGNRGLSSIQFLSSCGKTWEALAR